MGRVSRVFWLSLLAGGLLGLIGVRFLIVPDAAAMTFGLADQLRGHELHYVIALRDIWLGGMGIALAVLREWRCLALWFAGAASVCLLDSLIVLYSSANPWAIAFHLGAALFCALVGRGAWKLYRAELAVGP